MCSVYAGRRVVSVERIRLCAEHILGDDDRVLLAVLFGSASRGEPARDVDIGVYTAGDFTLGEMLGYGVRLEECIGHRVDLVPLKDTPPLLRLTALTRGIPLIVRDERLILDLRLAALHEYWDVGLKRRLWGGVSPASVGGRQGRRVGSASS